MSHSTKQILLSILFLLSILTESYAQQGYQTLFIDEGLTNNAQGIVRKYDTNVQILSSKKMLITKTWAITILNNSGDSFAKFIAYYSNFEKIKNIKIVIYNAFGNKIKQVKKNEIRDYPAEDGFSLYNDTRVLYYQHIPASYPYTIEVSYKTESSNTAFIPDYYPVWSSHLSVEQSNYKITYPADLNLHYKYKESDLFNIEQELLPQSLAFSVKNISAITPEDYAPHLSSLVPKVSFALEQFSLAGVKGNAKNWQELGLWINEKLLKDRNTLSEETKNKILSIVKDAPNNHEKAKRIYEYMQDKTRYVSVQIGIGGWRPMPAMEVDQKAYGDCKALANYTKSLLDIAGIDSYYTLVYGGSKRNIDNDLVCLQGNHAILMIPEGKDTIWLECTSQKVPFGFIGGFTDDREVFVVNPSGSKIVKTKNYESKNNRIATTATINIDKDLGIEASINIKNCGKAYDDIYYIEFIKKDKQKLHYKKSFSNLSTVKVSNIKFENDKTNICFNETLDLKAQKYLTALQEDEYFFNPNIFSAIGSVPSKNDDRKFPIYIESGFLHQDKVTLIIPEGYAISYIPEDKTINGIFGTYKMHISKVSDTKIIYERSFEINAGTFPKEEYKAYRKFIKQIYKSDRQKIIIKKIQL